MLQKAGHPIAEAIFFTAGNGHNLDAGFWSFLQDVHRFMSWLCGCEAGLQQIYPRCAPWVLQALHSARSLAGITQSICQDKSSDEQGKHKVSCSPFLWPYLKPFLLELSFSAFTFLPPHPLQIAMLLPPTASCLPLDWRGGFGTGHQFLELVSVIVFGQWRFNI